ncbi:ATP-binding cassette domain-containing protein [Actinomadura spongiicola]|uniref:ATP-binding cassette domain-containing protein n=1 Tax=Actinomadura spongiicola TaxID=2303421 RepID=A0A372GL00_9ACTN|nr:ATP-binding cassette domain-containing protein [Actinomadura spongiicola]RFS86048.1 ATP-binding cassette domain-containing protein [Actinomadura spongiicola]
MIVVEGLTKRFGEKRAVDRLSFTVRPGVVTGFLGPNGAGKSTTMRMIVGLDRPDAGSVLVDGRPYAELSAPLRTVGALLDAGWARPRHSARTHLRWVASLNGISPGRVDELLRLVGLGEVAGQRVGTLSLGMRQRLGMAMALLGDPRILLFDEPMNGLDPEGIRWIRQLLRQFATEGRTVLVSSHLLSEMAITADEVVVIGAGRLIASGPTAEFVEHAAQAVVVVRADDTEHLAGELRRAGHQVETRPDGALAVTGTTARRVGQIAAGCGEVLHELRTDHGSLEEAFMRTTRDAVEYRAADVVPAGVEER